VKEIEFFDFDGYVYDVEVPCPHNFVANGMLAHNTAGEGMFVRALELSGRLPDGCALFVVPQDLARQTQEEFHRFFGRDLWLVSHLGCASGKERKPKGERYISAVQLREMVRARRRDLAMQRQGFSLAPRPPVWAATWFEALARTDRMDEILPVETVRRMKIETAPAQPERRANWYSHEMLPATPAEYEWRTFTSADICPSCGSSRVQDAQADHGWNGTICRAEIPEDKRTPKHRICGYVHRKLLRKPAYSILAGLFKVVVVDEGTKIKGDDSLASKAVRALRGEYRLLMTGTPMKNFVVDLYWLLWWALGDGSPRFPYSYRGGRQRFTDDFAVVETRLNEWGHKERGAQPKVLPEVSNLLRLWKMLCSSLVRRRMDDVGCVVSHEGDWTCPACKASNRAEVQGQAGWSKPDRLTCPYCDTVWDSLAPLTYIPVSVPWGAAQRMFYSKWLDKQNFARHFLAKHPSSPLAEHPDVIPILAASLGQLAKLEYATTDPMGDPDPDYRDSVAGLSRWTPNRLKVLQLAVEHARAGEKVLVGSSLVAPGPWIAERLCERNVRAVHICEEDAEGCVTTKAPAKRADAVADFRQGRADVLCVGVNAMCLGHNLDVASVVIVDGLPWDFATWDQFVKRARRLTSKRPVKVYVMLPADSLATKKWSLLKDKTASADLALDGRLARQDERPVDRAAVLRELQDRGVRFDGTEVPEAQVQRMWADALATERPVLPVPVASHRMSVVDAQGRTSYWPAPATSPAQAPASPANGHANAADARNGQAPRVCIRRGKARVYGEREGDVYVCTGTRGRMSVLYPPGREGDPESAVLVETKDVASARDIGLLFAV